ncbi:MAG: GTP 3',8-cyclase MoaA [Verrucomicrobia bacterium]|nr:GTP 3',8-cyclase MoaA [Verrucomicrobiota bacterium]NBR62744.1 GTP 3',8-cyclase MoaA [Verrucomicrobiota bacterium]
MTSTPSRQPLDTLGRPVRDLRVSLTDRCNLRCTYCMPAEVFDHGHTFLRKDQLMRLSELDRIIGAFVRCGVRKLRITGGEPLLRAGLVKFLHGLRRFPELEDLAMTTNGLLLPGFASQLAAAGLHRVTVSLDALDPEVFGLMNGRGQHPERVLAGIEAARAAGLGIKINMVVQRGVNDGQILPMAKYCKSKGLVLRFIEFMDVGNFNHWDPSRVISGQEILAILTREFDFDPVPPTCRGEVAQRFRYRDTGNEFGLITSISAPFCRDCTRARLSADGRLFHCLFASEGYDLVGALRTKLPDEESLDRLVADLWSRRADRYSEIRSQAGSFPKVEMSFIGG